MHSFAKQNRRSHQRLRLSKYVNLINQQLLRLPLALPQPQAREVAPSTSHPR